MENASKALLIAGSILIVILIIGVGMLVYSSMQGTIDEGLRQMSNQEKDIFNQQFLQFEGTKNGSNVKSLRSKVESNNSQLEEGDPRMVKWGDGSIDMTKINTALTYNVEVKDTNGDGLMDEITVTQKSTQKK